jgi:hypothetical protein
MGMITWGMVCRRGVGGTREVGVRGLVVAMVKDGVVGIREGPQVGTIEDRITEVLL